jgi:hypothetical protein
MAARCWRIPMVATSASAWGGDHVRFLQHTLVVPEQVEGADGHATQAHGYGVDRPEAGLQGDGPEPGPASVVPGQVLVEHGFAGAVAVETGAFLGLELEQLDQAHLLAGRGHHPQVPFGGDQHQAGGGHVEHLHAPVGEPGQQLHDIEVVNQSVGQLHHRPGQQCFSRHRTLPPHRFRTAH